MSSKKLGKTVTIRLLPLEDDEAEASTSQRVQPRRSSAGRPPVRPVATKSRYKIYEIPRKSEFSEYLEKIRKKQETEATTSERRSFERISSMVAQEPQEKFLTFDKPVLERALVGGMLRQGSVVEYRPKRRHPFKEMVSEYLRRQSMPQKTITLYKIPLIQSWDQAIEYSLRSFPIQDRTGPTWTKPRLKWLEDLEHINRTVATPPTQRTPDSDEELETICCFPIRRI
ncbi:uncharacterized protein LOC126578845 [Anopheles aquasalis]|uniref:uncharacterized protein LOC126578845 n=1 Tax=Anopheles aquasalis TaxID=42839 RepID=UPI00215A10D6|nr:uncharacterized protein LOC126578845 [Anopheles aquasalis]